MRFIQAFNLACVLLISSCALSNQGEVDVFYSSSSTTHDNENSKLYPIFVDKVNKSTPFLEGDLVSFHLVNAFIGNFDEDALAPAEFGQYASTFLGASIFGGRSPRVKGEIAIVARVFEFTGSGTGDFDFGPEADGRVVFYSDDVTRHQKLNLRNIPIYGPVKRPSGPLAFRIEGAELDTSSEQEKALLSQLSSLGSIAYAPASPALGVLETIGSSFINSQPDHTKFFRMTMLFSPQTGGNDNHLELRPGYYIFIKDPHRRGNKHWDRRVELNKETGLLMKKGCSLKKKETEAEKTEAEKTEKEVFDIKKYNKCEFRDFSYLVVEVGRNVGEGEVQIRQEGFRALIDTLRDADQRTAERILNASNEDDFERTIARQRLESDIRNDILLAAGDTSNQDTDDRVIAGMEALTILSREAIAICDREPMDESANIAILERSQIDYLFQLVRRSNQLSRIERSALLPSTINGYCKRQSELDNVNEPSELPVARLSTICNAERYFNIMPGSQNCPAQQ